MRNCVFIAFLFLVVSTVGAEGRIKIGVSTALTGDASTYGTDIKNALLFANKKLGGDRYKLIIEDDRCSGQGAATVAQKLISIDRVKYVLGHACSSAVLGSAPIYERSGIIVISPSASAEAVSQAGDFIFRTWPSDIKAVEILYNHVASKHKIFGIVSEETEYAQGFLREFKRRNQGESLALVTESFLTSTSDYRTLLTKLVSKNLEGLFLNSQSERTFLALLKQVRELRIDVPVYGVYWPGSSTFREQAGSLADGITYVDAPTADEALSQEGRELLKEFISEYGQPKFSGFLFATAFEAFRSLHEAIQSGQNPKSHLYSQQHTGIIGRYSFNKNGDIIGIPMMLKRIENGKTINLG